MQIIKIFCYCYQLLTRAFNNLTKEPSILQISELKTTMRSPKRVIVKASTGGKEAVDGSSISPKSLFAFPRNGGLHMLDSLNFVDESSDQDLLLEFPSNNSFPQAELLLPNSSFVAQGSTSSSSVYSHVTRP